MKKILIASIISIILFTSFYTNSTFAAKPALDSEQLRLQDMLLIMLYPYIKEEISKYYSPIFTTFSPEIELWKVDVIESKRVNGFRGFILEIKLDIEPSTGHHVSIGKDRLTYQLSYGPTVKLIKHTHLATYEISID